MYEIKKIEWQKLNIQRSTFNAHQPNQIISTNTFITYSIYEPVLDINDNYSVFYNGRHPKEFKTLEDAKEWIEFTHYPSVIAQYMTLI